MCASRVRVCAGCNPSQLQYFEATKKELYAKWRDGYWYQVAKVIFNSNKPNEIQVTYTDDQVSTVSLSEARIVETTSSNPSKGDDIVCRIKSTNPAHALKISVRFKEIGPDGSVATEKDDGKPGVKCENDASFKRVTKYSYCNQGNVRYWQVLPIVNCNETFLLPCRVVGHHTSFVRLVIVIMHLLAEAPCISDCIHMSR